MSLRWQSLVDLVKLYDLVRDQYQVAKRALVGRGNFKLSPSFAHHRIDKAVWPSKTPSERESLFQKFLKDCRSGIKAKYVRSTDGNFTERTRKHCNRTTNVPTVKHTKLEL